MAERNVTAQEGPATEYCHICDIEFGLKEIHPNRAIVVLKDMNGDVIIPFTIASIKEKPAVVRELHERCTKAGFFFVYRSDRDTNHITYQHAEKKNNIPYDVLVTGNPTEFSFPLIDFNPHEFLYGFIQQQQTLAEENSASTGPTPAGSTLPNDSTPPTDPTPPTTSAESLNMSEPQSLKRAASKQPSNTPKRSTKATAADKILSDPEAVLQNEKSPIYAESLNLKAVLTHPKAQEVLLKAGIDLSNLSSEDLSAAIAAFKEDGRSGRHDPDWLAQANEASKIRQAGGFDEYQKAKFKEDWDVDDDDFKEETEMQAKVESGRKMSSTIADSEEGEDEGDKDEIMAEGENVSVCIGGDGHVEKAEKGDKAEKAEKAEMVDEEGDKSMDGLA